MLHTDGKTFYILTFVVAAKQQKLNGRNLNVIYSRVEQKKPDLIEECTCSAAYLYPRVLQAGTHLFKVIPYQGTKAF